MLTNKQGGRGKVSLKRIVGFILLAIAACCAGYVFGATLNIYLPDAILLKTLIFVSTLSSGIYLMIKNRRYASYVL
uniref:Uncharacterized protein n=1 Tax=viral metagenome TaxID=1070528 RepID=A0A6H1ZZP9_9ZZZZ